MLYEEFDSIDHIFLCFHLESDWKCDELNQLHGAIKTLVHPTVVLTAEKDAVANHVVKWKPFDVYNKKKTPNTDEKSESFAENVKPFNMNAMRIHITKE